MTGDAREHAEERFNEEHNVSDGKIDKLDENGNVAKNFVKVEHQEE
jgi:hypothetical protein